MRPEVIIGKKIRDLGYEPGLQPAADYFAIKMPVFSFEKIRGAEISLGPEMKSTGECLGIAKNFNEALYKAFLGAGVKLPKYKQMIITVKDADKPEAAEVAKRFEKLGYKIYATRSTAKFLQEAGVDALRVNKISQESPNVMDLILGHKIDLVIDTPTQGRDKSRDGFLIRRNAIETGVNCHHSNGYGKRAGNQPGKCGRYADTGRYRKGKRPGQQLKINKIGARKSPGHQ